MNLIDRMIDQLHSFFVDFNYGHAPVKRTKWSAPAAQQTLLLVESIQQQKLNAAGSYYCVLPQIARRHGAILIANNRYLND